MSAFKVCMHIGAFDINIKIDKDVRIKNNNIGRKIDHEKRINNAIEKRKDILTNYNCFHNQF